MFAAPERQEMGFVEAEFLRRGQLKPFSEALTPPGSVLKEAFHPSATRRRDAGGASRARSDAQRDPPGCRRRHSRSSTSRIDHFQELRTSRRAWPRIARRGRAAIRRRWRSASRAWRRRSRRFAPRHPFVERGARQCGRGAEAASSSSAAESSTGGGPGSGRPASGRAGREGDAGRPRPGGCATRRGRERVGQAGGGRGPDSRRRLPRPAPIWPPRRARSTPPLRPTRPMSWPWPVPGWRLPRRRWRRPT